MKKGLWILALTLVFAGSTCFAAPPAVGMGGRPPMQGGVSMGRPPMGARPPMGPPHGGMARPPMHMAGRPLPPPPMIRPMPIYRPYYTSFYPSVYYTSYSYTPYVYDEVGAVTPVSTVVVRDDYAGINTAANVINTAANVAATIRYLTW